MNRKIVVSVLAVAMLACACVAEAQQPANVRLIGVLGDAPSSFWEAFRQGLRDLGYIEGQSIAIEYRWAEGKYERLPDLAAELVGLKVHLIVTAGVTASRAAKQATKTIPIVMIVGSDPVETGLVASLARPGGNTTGLASINVELNPKRLELLKEAVPGLYRVAVLANATSSNFGPAVKAVEAAARSLGLQLQILEVRDLKDFDAAFEAAKKQRAGALIVLPSTMFFSQRKRIAELAGKNHMSTISADMDYVEVGGLIAYGPSFPDMYRRAAYFVDKILKGAKPADLPVEQPMKFELIINLKAAKQIGLTIPPNVLARANKVIK